MEGILLPAGDFAYTGIVTCLLHWQEGSFRLDLRLPWSLSAFYISGGGWWIGEALLLLSSVPVQNRAIPVFVGKEEGC